MDKFGFINSNGVLFGKMQKVNTAGIVASTKISQMKILIMETITLKVTQMKYSK